MNVTIQIPDEIARRLTAAGEDLSRRALEALAVEEYRHDRLTKPELRRLLGIETSYQLDGVLKAHGVWIEYTRWKMQNANARGLNVWVFDSPGGG